MPQTVLLREQGLRRTKQILALARHSLCLHAPAVAQGYGGQAILAVVLVLE